MMSEQGETTEAPKAEATEGEPAQSGAMRQPTRIVDGEVAYHLHLDRTEARVATGALHLLISDEAHEPLIRRIAREVLAELEREPAGDQPLVVALSPPGMKITHTAVKLLLDDLRRDQAADRRTLRQILDKLPDEHAIRAITLQ
jgi:hypothetical protein